MPNLAVRAVPHWAVCTLLLISWPLQIGNVPQNLRCSPCANLPFTCSAATCSKQICSRSSSADMQKVDQVPAAEVHETPEAYMIAL